MRFSIPAQVLVGPDSLAGITSGAKQTGVRALLVTEAILYQRDTISQVQEALESVGYSCLVYDEVVPNATTASVEAAIALARGARVNLIVGLGGIRTLSIARTVAYAVNSRYDIYQIIEGYQADAPALPFIAMPTTCRDPFLFLGQAFITDARDRNPYILTFPAPITTHVIVDPRFSLSLPAKFTAATMLDGILCAAEGYLSSKPSVISDGLFLRAISVLFSAIRQAVARPEDIRIREQASEAGVALALGQITGSFGFGTSLAYTLNAQCMIPKSWTSTVILPEVLEFYQEMNVERVADIARAMDPSLNQLPSDEAAIGGVEQIRTLINDLKLPTRLRDLDIELERLASVVETSFILGMASSLHRSITSQTVLDILRHCY